jgi:hypothetical protein
MLVQKSAGSSVRIKAGKILVVSDEYGVFLRVVQHLRKHVPNPSKRQEQALD